MTIQQLRSLSCTSGYRAGGENASISFAIGDSPLGKMIVAGTAAGICFIGFDDSEDKLIAELRGDFPKATIDNRPALPADWTKAIASYLEGRAPMPDLPLDIRGTEFQFHVWNHLREIPIGETRSYTAVARHIGHADAIRAVGTANGANPVSILIPCHRALRASGHLGGYRWGLERKRKLLELEASFARA
jgi:AraC family transcriptional regulator of adaptative response/methylated-DNA-[protein]-cysteine methyltransferase